MIFFINLVHEANTKCLTKSDKLAHMSWSSTSVCFYVLIANTASEDVKRLDYTKIMILRNPTPVKEYLGYVLLY